MNTREPPTVVVTTKNTASLTLGIAALVVGVLSLLVGWIPFLGFLAMPTAVIGLVLAGIGLVIAIFKGGKGIGMPLLGGIICGGAFILPVLSTGATLATIEKVVDHASKKGTAQRKVQVDGNTNSVSGVSEAESEQEDQDDREAKVKAAYIRDHIILYDLQARYMESILDGKVPGVLFKLRNTGDRDLDMVKVTVFFKDASGAVIHEEDYTPVLVSDFSFGDNKPLKAGYIWQMERGKFYAAKSVPSEWQEGSVEAKVTDIKFSK